MRRILLIAPLAALVSASVAFAATGRTSVRAVSLHDAMQRTAHVSSQRFAVDVRITKGRQPVTLHVRGASGPSALSMKMRTDDLTLPDGTVVPGMDGAVLVDGPFLYERAPNGMAVGKLRWLRQRLADLSPASPDLSNIRNMTPVTLLQVLGEARMQRVPLHAGDAWVFRGALAYDDPVVRRGLSSLTGNVEFRGLRITAWVGGDRLLHRLRITGRTADGASALRLDARLYAFGRHVHVQPPALGSFLDAKREQLTN
jgi:hypothetical protein